MRTVLVAALLGACIAGPIRPATQPKLSELPADAQKRDAVLDSANAQPTSEQRNPLPPKMRKVETAAATAAAVLGMMFSKTTSATLGVLVPIEEQPHKASAPPDNDKVDKSKQAPERAPGDLVPWVRLR